MSEEPLFLISIDSEMRPEDRATLLKVIEKDVQLHPHSQKQFGPGWIEFVAIARDVAIVGGGAASMIKLAKEIIDWVGKHRAKEPAININIIVQRPGRKKLRIPEAHDSEILQWFSEK